jgi:hypothetical protein
MVGTKDAYCDNNDWFRSIDETAGELPARGHSATSECTQTHSCQGETGLREVRNTALSALPETGFLRMCRKPELREAFFYF